MKNLLQSLKNKLHVATLREDLEKARNNAAADDWQEEGRRVMNRIAETGKFFGTARCAISGMRFAFASLNELGVAPSMVATGGISKPEEDYWLQTKQGNTLTSLKNAPAATSVMAAYRELTLASAATDPDPVAKSSPAPPAPAAAKPAASACKPPVAAAKPLPAVQAPKPVPASAEAPKPTKPDFSSLHGMDRTRAAMAWDEERKRAAKQVQKPATPPQADPAGITAVQLAKAIVDEQEARANAPTGLARTAAAFAKAERPK